MGRSPLVLLAILGAASRAVAQQPAAPDRGRPTSAPVIDVHVHTGASGSFASKLAELDSAHVVLAVVNGPPAATRAWAAAAPGRFRTGVLFPCVTGRVPLGGPPCFADGGDFPSLDSLRADIRAGRVAVLGELTAQYAGLAPDDARLKPYYALAEELDIPVAIHLALAPPGTPYRCCPAYRSALGNPLGLEPILARHPKLRIWVMHAGYPYAAEIKALMLVYQQLYVDIAAINQPFILPRAEFHTYLEGLMRAGLGKRILFGSDYAPISGAIAAIESAPFLTAEQKRDILYNNAVTFFRLPPGAP